MSAFDDWFAPHKRDFDHSDAEGWTHEFVEEAFKAGLEAAAREIEQGKDGLPRTWEDDVLAIRALKEAP